MINHKTIREYAILNKIINGGTHTGYETRTASGVIASFETNTELPITEGKFNIAYNSNGLSSMVIARCGKNLAKNVIVANNPYSSMTFDNAFFLPVGVYRCSISNAENMTSWRFGFCFFKSDGTTITNAKTNGYVTLAPNIGWSDTYSSDSVVMESTDRTDTQILLTVLKDCYVVPCIGFGDVSSSTTLDYQLELGSTPSTYEAYSGDTYPVSFGTTIYGGYFESETGVLTSTKASDGTDLATPVKTELTPIPINTFNGANNIFCNTGDTEIKYLYEVEVSSNGIMKYLPFFYDFRK